MIELCRYRPSYAITVEFIRVLKPHFRYLFCSERNREYFSLQRMSSERYEESGRKPVKRFCCSYSFFSCICPNIVFIPALDFIIFLIIIDKCFIGLPPSGSWQDLKDHMREAGDVCFADSFKDGTGVVEFLRYEDMKYAIKKLDDSRFRSHEVSITSLYLSRILINFKIIHKIRSISVT